METMQKKGRRAWTEEEKKQISERMRQNHAKRKALKEAKAVNSFSETTPSIIAKPIENHKRMEIVFNEGPKEYTDLNTDAYQSGFDAGYAKGAKDLQTTLANMPAYDPKWANRDFMLLMPIYRETNVATLFTCMALALDFGVHGMRFDAEAGDAVVSNARNKLANRFLTTGANWSLWLDADMVAPIGRGALFRNICHLPGSYPDKNLEMHVAHRLLSHNKTIVGATYFGRNQDGAPMFSEGLYNKDANEAARQMQDGIRKTEWVGTGCVLIHRQVFLDIQAKFPELGPKTGQSELSPVIKYKLPDGTLTETYQVNAVPEVVGHIEKKIWRDHWDFFRLGEGTDGEDVAFFKKAKEAGHECWVDTGLQCFHVGYQAYGSHNTRNVSKQGSVSGLF